MILRAVERGSGGLPLVMLHGLFGRAGNFGAVQARLAERSRVVALDLRGHGASPHASPMNYAVMADDVAETARELKAWPCALLGHSMGGKVAMTLALTEPEAVARLIVADVAPVTYPSHFGAFVAAMQGLPLTPGLTRATADAALAGAIPEPRVRAFLLQNLRVGPDPAWTCDLAGIAKSLRAIESWPETSRTFAGPTLVLAGARSTYVQSDGWAAARALFPAARLTTLPEAGHWLHAEDPNGFTAAVEDFLSAPD